MPDGSIICLITYYEKGGTKMNYSVCTDTLFHAASIKKALSLVKEFNYDAIEF